MRCLTNFAAFGNCICKLFRLAVKPGELLSVLLGEAGKFLRYSFTALALSENSFIRLPKHLTVTFF